MMSDANPTPDDPQQHAGEPTLVGGLSTTSSTKISTPPLRRFGDYELLVEIGRGGMGVVYKARQEGLNRFVALKMLLPGSLSSEEDLRRFRTEVEATAKLQHPNIVAIHEVGEIDGTHFYSMDFIDGPSLAQRLKDGPLPTKVAARYVLAIAQAIHHAHRQEILHRDLKPSNILIDSEDRAHVADFGLAKKIGSGESGKTRTGAILGTPSYMAPEQAAGRTKDLGPPTDVYGLGAILYELITTQPPFQADTPFDTLMHVLERNPTPPSDLNPKVEPDLETVCLKCLEKDPNLRYESSQELASDLERFLNNESIKATSLNVLDRLSRTLERSHYVYEFRGWGNMVLTFAVIILIENLIVWFLVQGGQYPLRWLIPARISQFVLMGGTFLWYRKRQLLPTSTAERQLWTIWIGYLISVGTIGIATRMIEIHKEIDIDDLTLFPVWAVLSGLSFFTMGSCYWGRCYAYGILFFLLAIVMTLKLALSPLLLGLLWAVVLTDLGLYLRRLVRETETE